MIAGYADNTAGSRTQTRDEAATTLNEGLHSDALTVDELACLLRLNRKTVYAAVRAGEIPGVRFIGRAIRISRTTVEKWLQEGQGRVPRSRRNR